jgi:predicted MPP superfamily phosphohydrolase
MPKRKLSRAYRVVARAAFQFFFMTNSANVIKIAETLKAISHVGAAMFDVLKSLTRHGRDQKALMKFYDELKKNLEIFYVMDQRQFIDMEFRAAAWGRIKDLTLTKTFPKILAYGSSVEDFNGFYRRFKEFEKWYAADMANKTKDNAQKLHTQRSELEGKLKTMYPVICSAGEELEYKLIDLGLIKK